METYRKHFEYKGNPITVEVSLITSDRTITPTGAGSDMLFNYMIHAESGRFKIVDYVPNTSKLKDEMSRHVVNIEKFIDEAIERENEMDSILSDMGFHKVEDLPF